MNKRYFAMIIAQNRESFPRLHEYGLDLVHGSARTRDREQPIVEALLTMEEVARLVEDGYRVLVEKEASKRPGPDRSWALTDGSRKWGVSHATIRVPQRFEHRVLPPVPVEHLPGDLSARRAAGAVQGGPDDARRDDRLRRGQRPPRGAVHRGVHARELVNPDALVGLGLLVPGLHRQHGADVRRQTYAASTIKLIVDAMDVFILPLVNPDGRVYVQSPTGDP